MGLFDGFPFKTKEQQQREERAFQKRVFPLGPGQKEAAQRVVCELLQGMDQQEALFAFICAKDAWQIAMEDERYDEVADSALQALQNQRGLSGQQKKLLVTFVRLETHADSLENYPTADEVRAAAQGEG